MAPKVRTKGRSSALIVLGLAALGVYALDQTAKFLVVSSLTEGSTVRVLGDVLQWHYVRNPGAAFSLATGMTWIFTIIAAAVVVFIVIFAGRIRSLAWALVFGLLLGGVLGNLTDRLFREPSFGLGHVVDFITTPWLIPAIYNVADASIVTSMVIFMILTIRGIGLDGRRAVREPAGTSDATADDADPADPGSAPAPPLPAEGTPATPTQLAP
ncbi:MULTISPECIES: signal peptidase II [unclassified Cryobacterium]|uniref:signal peptidase II n=1 Tax=unclassified Cryobacterium TaxID=2649013 RepID=UPI00106A292C|nr:MULTISPECIES: signal peptidase II [unclassified Cryobacterium]TFB92153.1 signal peptidase II [Cryobacterium sp. MDB2-A-1]TFC11686.1 signal peptidase II [Cryobacterium sp. MDB2-33-2]TFC15509.1 signal peptidase II [Cryobacterium sp. MDB2-A-2]TFC20221.1 signal peptidase II [Cryobacterium sp. MDB2-10]